MNPAVTPTPRDDRVRVLATLTHGELNQRALALGYQPDGWFGLNASDDELIAMILDAEQDRGLVAR